MFGITLKRSAAALGVVAGLLAAAGPAAAQVLPGTIGVKAPTKAGTQVGHEGHNAVAIQKHDHQNALVNAPSKATDPSGAGASFTLGVASSEVFELNTFGLTEHEGAAFRGEVTGLEPNAFGTQVGSEGVKGHRPAPASSRAGAFALELEGKIVKAPASPTSLVFTSVSNVAVATAVVGGIVPGGAIVSA